MEKIEIVLREFSLKGKRIIISKDLRSICSKYDFDFNNTKKLLLNKGYLITIFRGIYYLKDYNERKMGVIKYSSSELLAEGMKIKGIKNWYFGLNTAIKLLNLTHEVFTIDYVINDKFNRVKPIDILGSKFLFRKIKTPLFFGIEKLKTKNGINLRYSNLEKTFLDSLYLSKKLIGYSDKINRERLLKYSKHYPPTVKFKLKEWLDGQS
ncbi:MAG: hypothetical protein V3U19_03535 [Thermodesulfobacteriota bacterium]